MVSSICLFAFVVAAATAQFNCPKESYTQMTEADRQAVIEAHNQVRSLLTTGKAEMKDGQAKRAKNIYKMTYDCELEKQSQKWIDKCKFEHSPQSYRNAGENLYMASTTGNLGPYAGYLKSAVQSWWNEIKLINQSKIPEENGGAKLDNYVFGNGAGHWSQVAWATSTKVGCGISKCSKPGSSWKTVMIDCEYREQGNFWNSQIYEYGNGCSQDSDCSLFPGSRCDKSMQLCEVQ